MKRQLNYFDALSVAFVGLLITGNLKPWWLILVPHCIEFLLSALEVYKFQDKLKFWLFKQLLNRRVKAADKKARKEFGSNPGSKETAEYFKD